MMKSRPTTTASLRNMVKPAVAAVVFFSLLVWVRCPIMKVPGEQRHATAISQGDRKNADFSLAFQHSNFFFDDIPNSEWQKMQAHVREMQPNMCQDGDGCSPRVKNDAAVWFQSNFEPEFGCRHERRIGGKGDGGKWVCDPDRLKKNKNCLVYSVGSNNNFLFEEGVFANLGTHCEVHTFDPADYSSRANSIRKLQEPSTIHMLQRNNITYGPGTDVEELNLNYHAWGIAKKTYFNNNNGLRFFSMEDTVKKLGHVGRTIHLFKIDCEGCEKNSFESWVNFDPSFVELQQVLVEVHAINGRVNEVENFFLGMHRHGYVMFHKEINIIAATVGHKSTFCSEFSFLKLHPDFFATGATTTPN